MKKSGVSVLAMLGYVVVGLLTLYFMFKLFASSPMEAFDRLLLVIGVVLAVVMTFFVEGVTIFTVLGVILASALGSLVVIYLMQVTGMFSSSVLQQTGLNPSAMIETIKPSTEKTDSSGQNVVVVTSEPQTSEPQTVIVETPVVATPIQVQYLENNPSNKKFYKQGISNDIDVGEYGKDLTEEGSIVQDATNTIHYNGQKVKQTSQNKVILQNGVITQIKDGQKIIEKEPTITEPVVIQTAKCETECPRYMLRTQDLNIIIDNSTPVITQEYPNGKIFRIQKTNLGYIYYTQDDVMSPVIFPTVQETKDYLNANYQ